MIKKIRNWVWDLFSFYCKGYWTESTTNGPSEYDCDYLYADIGCDQCLVNGGMYNPETGKKDYIKHFFIIFGKWLNSLLPKCKNCIHSYCVLDVIPDWRCKESGKDKMIEPNSYCENWRVR